MLGFVVAGAQLAPAAFAQVLEEIVVTAQRREQSLQDVPIAVTAFSGEAIERQNINSAIDYLALTPNVSYTEDGQFGKRGAGISVRGVNNLVSGENASVPSIGVYLDEFSVASVPNQFSNPQLPDMQRIEVLRGPQGTFFGRNAVGGALNLITRNPTDEFEGKIVLGVETYEDAGEEFSITGVLNGPVSDAFKLRGVVTYEDNSGYVTNICAAGATAAGCPVAVANNFTPNGTKDSGHEYLSVRLKGLWELTDATQIVGTLIYADEDQGHDENVPSGILDLDTVDTFGIQAGIDPGTGFWPNNQNSLSHDLPETNVLETVIGILTVQHSFSDSLSLKWITGVIDSEFNRLFEQDLIGGLDALSRTNKYDGTSASTELRLESTGDRFDWIAGVMVSRDDQNQDNLVAVSTRPTDTINGIGLLPPFPTGLGLAFNNKSFEIDGVAAFADLTFHLNDQLDLIVGGRYSHDEVNTDLMSFAIGPGPDSCDPGVDIVCFFQGFVNTPRPAANGSQTFDDVAPRAGLSFQATESVNVYGMISKGYKAGGTSVGNDTNAAGQPPISVPYDEEILWNYELGIKAELLNQRLRLNTAVFYSLWEDMQFEAFRLLTPGDLSSNFEQTINIAEATAIGLEVEFQALLTENFSITGALGVLDTEIDDPQIVEITGGYDVTIDGRELPKAPELSYNLAGEYRLPVAGNDAWLRLEFIHRDGQYSDIEGLTNTQTRGPSPNQGLSRPVGPGEFPFLSPDFDVLNLRGGWEAERWGFQVYVENLTDEEYYTGTQENFGASGVRLRPHPRIIGGSLNFNF
jgi:iron complex outermembrane receptor protein